MRSHYMIEDLTDADYSTLEISKPIPETISNTHFFYTLAHLILLY